MCAKLSITAQFCIKRKTKKADTMSRYAFVSQLFLRHTQFLSHLALLHK